MPIITVKRFTEGQNETVPKARVQALADQLGDIFNSGKGQTWVTVECQPRAHYAENGQTTEGVFPTYVEVLKGELEDPESLVLEAEQIAAAVSKALGCPLENTHILYLPAADGRIAFGGKLLRRQ